MPMAGPSNLSIQAHLSIHSRLVHTSTHSKRVFLWMLSIQASFLNSILSIQGRWHHR